MKLALVASLFFLSVSSLARADSGNLLQCTDRHFVLQQCKLASTTVAAAPTDNGEPFEAEYLVTYDFPCSGHHASVGLRAGDGAPVTLSQGVLGGTVAVTGKGDLVPYDPDPTLTSHLSFRPGCKLVVTNVSAAPSTDTILAWTSEAKTEARILAMARDLYVLSKSFASIASFDRTQLGVVIDATQARVDAASTPIDRRRWKSLLDSLVAMRDAQPLPVPKNEVDAYLANLASDARASLLREADTARAIADRFTTWSVAVEQTLQEVIRSLPAA